MSEQFYFKQFSLVKIHSLVLFDPVIGTDQVPISGSIQDHWWAWSDSNEWVLHIPQSSCITGTSPSVYSVFHLVHLLMGSYPVAEKKSVYSTVQTTGQCVDCEFPVQK